MKMTKAESGLTNSTNSMAIKMKGEGICSSNNNNNNKLKIIFNDIITIITIIITIAKISKNIAKRLKNINIHQKYNCQINYKLLKRLSMKGRILQYKTKA